MPSLESRHYAERVKEKRKPTTDVRHPIRKDAPPHALRCHHAASACTERAHTQRTNRRERLRPTQARVRRTAEHR